MTTLKNINYSPRLTQHLVTSKIFASEPFIVVDIGARGGFAKYWSLYGDQIKLVGFEADAEECERLNQQSAKCGHHFYPVALHQNKGRKPFYITAYSPSSGFYQPDMTEVGRFPDKVNLAVEKTLDIDTMDFDSFASENGFDYVDFIKLDTEGAELDILKGATRFLKKSVIGLSVEVWFQRWHKKQPFFSDIDLFLRPLGFKLFDLAINRSSREALPVPTASLIPGPTERGQVYCGQALFLRDGANEIETSSSLEGGWDDIKILKLASIMELFRLPDCAIELIQVASRKDFLKKEDSGSLIDLLVPPVGDKIVSYNEYLDYVRTVKDRASSPNIQRTKRLAVRFVPQFIRRIILRILVEIRDLINKIIK
ncbi:MAG: FkbM family methyltransferase [Dehalococcoidales bacterium]|jgi:FkbM family methyltransferase